MTKSRNINAPRHKWTAAELVILRDFYPITHTATVANTLGVGMSVAHKKAKELGLTKTTEHLATAAGRTDGRKGADTRFKPGKRPANAFKKGVRISPATEFKKGLIPKNVQEVGALRINSLGDIDIKIAEGHGNWLSLRRYMWEMAHGPVPDGMCIIMKDGDPHNTQPDNMALATRADNIRHNLHRRYPPELRNLMALRGRLKNQITKSTQTTKPIQPQGARV
jgi:HNH endonuclease